MRQFRILSDKQDVNEKFLRKSGTGILELIWEAKESGNKCYYFVCVSDLWSDYCVPDKIHKDAIPQNGIMERSSVGTSKPIHFHFHLLLFKHGSPIS